MGDVLENDDFWDAIILTINIKEVHKKYQEIIQHLDDMKFLIEATKVVWTQITHKSQNYSIIGHQLYFQGRNGVVMNHWKGWNLTSFVWISWWVLWRPLYRTNHNKKKNWKKIITGPPSSRMPMIIVRIVMYVKLMHKGLLWAALYTPTTFETFWKMGNWFNDQERALIHYGCHRLPHKVCRSTYLEIFSETRNNTIFIWTNIYLIWDTIWYCFW